jgi:uncharacterized protein with gpF-like domain
MPFDLKAMVSRTRVVRKKRIVLRDIVPPQTMATDLFRAAYLPIVEVWQRAAPRIEAEYARTLAEITTDAPADVQREIAAAESEATRLFLLLDARVRDWVLRTERWQRGKWRGAVLSATGVDLETLLGPDAVRASLETHLQWNTDLIADVSAQIKQRISNAVFDGLRNRTPAREVAKAISEATGLARDRSRRIASDQLAKLTSSLADERRREAGLADWEWKHSGKRHPRVDHQARDGKEYSDANPPPEMPGQLPYCGCRQLPLIKFD